MLPTRAWPAIAAYSAAKAGVLNLTTSLAAAFGPEGVRVNAICPGWVRMPPNRTYLADPTTATTAIDAVPLGCSADVDDLTGTALWLASDASRYVTGAVIPVDGGLSIGISRAWQGKMGPPRRAAQTHRETCP
ncbi:MAG TPA: SDR family oxidoreductase [Acidimicrobiales bacterium]|nr:SDR family oxidoreductase [Acidimicrobiales bacterium]